MIKSIWLKYQGSVAAIVFAALLGLCLHQLYWALTDNVVQEAFPRGAGRWVSYQTEPQAFIFFVVLYGIFALVLSAGFTTGWFETRQADRRWRSRPPVDDAIRQSPEDR
ncbi:MAG: hypothetical protein WDO17_26500 [Alphaproteobacteria bacterium]